LPAVTISCGIASYPDDAATARDLTRCADDAMYAAKAAGRNTVRAWDR
jgi:diguanylate cyclase (GGDEF)-like protein